jgi:hypothetical protein
MQPKIEIIVQQRVVILSEVERSLCHPGEPYSCHPGAQAIGSLSKNNLSRFKRFYHFALLVPE